MYRNHFLDEGFIIGVNWAYPLGWQEGVEVGVAAGRINGFMEGYKSGVFAWDDPYHVAALGFEAQFPWADVTLLAGNDDALAIAILLPDRTPPGYDGAVFSEAIVATLEPFYSGQSVVRIFLLQYNPYYNQIFVVKLIDFVAETFFEYRLGEGTEGTNLIYFPVECPEFLLEWPSNPYREPAWAEAGGGSGEVNPK
jgi:hypothetical protein